MLWKNIETLSSSIVLNEINCLNITRWDMGDLVHFFVIIWQFVIIWDWNMDFRNFTTHAAERRRAGAILGTPPPVDEKRTGVHHYSVVKSWN